MLNRIKTNKKNLYIVTLMFGILIFVLGVHNIEQYYSLINGVDEYGYLSCALYLAGKGNFEIASTLSYYSFGYSVFLMPLVKFINDPVVLFRSILVVNYLCIVVAFFLAVKVIVKLEKREPHIGLIILCGISFLYVSNYINAKYVFSESLIVLMIWIIIYLFQTMLERFTFFKLMMLESSCIYLYFIHQRTIALLLAMVIVLLILLLLKKIPVTALWTFVIPVFMFLIGQNIKELLINNVYLNSERLAINDYSSQFGKVKFIFSKDGFISLIYGIFSKIYYFNLASFFLAPLGVLNIANEIRKEGVKIYRERERSENDKCFLYLFILIAFIFAFGIQAIFLINPTRYDLVIYGRYIEYFSTFFIIYGLLTLYKAEKKLYMWEIIIIFCTIIGAFSAKELFEKYQLIYSKSYLAPGCFLFYDNVKNLEESVLITIILSFCLGFIQNIYLRLKQGKKYVFLSICLMTSLFWMYSANVIEFNIIEEQRSFKEEFFPLVEQINNSDKQIYYCVESKERYKRLRQVQYLCPKKEMLSISKEELEKLSDVMILTDNYEETEHYLLEQKKDIIYKNYIFKLWDIN